MGETNFQSEMVLNERRNAARNRSLSEQIFEVSQIIGEIFLLLLRIIYATCQGVYRTLVPLPETSVKGEIVLITGAGHGMGKELALLYASKGATVVGWDVNKKNNEETIKEIGERGFPKAYAYCCDVSNRENVCEVAKKVQKEVGDVTILINNAGIMPTHPIMDQTPTEIERMFNINVLAHFWTIQAFLPSMREKNHGHIVALSSCAGLFGLENLVPYCASKFAVRGLMESLYEELRRDNGKIGVTSIFPYMVDTGLCKKPRIRFEKIMPLLEPKIAARAIMKAQRTKQFQVSIPGYLLVLNSYVRIFPFKVGLYIKDFINSGVESDLSV